MTDPITIVVPGIPVPWSRAGKSGKRHFTPQRQREHMDLIRAYSVAAMRARPIISGPVSVGCSFIYQFPKSWPDKRRINYTPKTSRSDLDNNIKIVTDSLIGIVFQDDAQIYFLTAEKYYAWEDFTEITVRGLP